MTLTHEAFNAVTGPIEEALGLPNDAYTSVSFLKQEYEDVLGKGWIGIAFDDDVASPGDIFPVQAAGQPLIVLRDQQQRIRVFHNVCRHRGARLIDKPCSNKRRIICPYHAWAYGLDGELNATPNFAGPEKRELVSFPKGTQDLVEVRCAVWNHVVMVNLSGDAVPLTEWTETLAARWAGYDLQATLPGSELSYDFNANWKLTLENFLESYHLPMVHPTLNSYSPLSDHRVIVENLIMGQLSLNYQPDDDGNGLPRFQGLPQQRQATAEYLLLFPNLMLSVTPDHYRVTLITPISAEFTHQRWRFFFVGEGSRDARFAEAREAVVNRVDSYTREDISILEKLQAGRHSRAYDGGRFSPYHETTTHHFQKLIAHTLKENSSLSSVSQ
ncbi:MAG: aromatic ring-hydroxylating dioxygenase subunit alpha [Gammaproteobacteria bacterium]|nr:aromatic ring-hydroxylating dioxygenase subunit alpha [Gammaproteobacteria bacterium]